ncbi:HPr family phosphocarrier protein [Pseudoroseomonas cervicalis]
MLRREQEADTFLGNGIAIPHGQRGDRGLIRQTGIAVLQVPQGVRWNGEDTAHLVVAIAAQGDEHIAVLRRLTDVLGESDLADRLARTGDKAEILRALDPDAPAADAAPAPQAAAPAGAGLTAEVQAPAAAGMHARPARVLVQAAKGFQSRVTLRHGGRSADARSMIALLQLGAGPGAAITLEVSGPDEAAALAALRQAFAEQLGDDDTAAPGPPDAAPAAVAADEPLEPGHRGLPASPGIAIGVLHRFRSEAAGYAATATDPLGEQAALEAALEAARAELKTMAREMAQRVGDQHAAIFAAHERVPGGPRAAGRGPRRDRCRRSAPPAGCARPRRGPARWPGWATPRRRHRHEATSPACCATRWRRAGGAAAAGRHHPGRGSDALRDRQSRPRAGGRLATAAGGPTAHTAILARALGIPAIVAAGRACWNWPMARAPCWMSAAG